MRPIAFILSALVCFTAGAAEETRALALETARNDFVYIASFKLRGFSNGKGIWEEKQLELDRLKKKYDLTDKEIEEGWKERYRLFEEARRKN